MSNQPTESQEAAVAATTVAIDAVGGRVVLAIKRADASASLVMDAAQARQISAAIAARADEAHVQTLELQLEAARREIAELRQQIPAKDEVGIG